MRNSQPISLSRVSVIQPKPDHVCDFKACTRPGEFVLIGDASLCVEHFLRDRVRLNIGRMS